MLTAISAHAALFIHNFKAHVPSANPLDWINSVLEVQEIVLPLGDAAPRYELLAVSLVFIVLMAIARFVLEKFFFMPLGKYLGKITHSEKWVVTNPDRIQKFSEILFKFIFHASMTYWALQLLATKSWFSTWFQSTDHCWYDYPLQPVDDDVKLFYMVQLAYHTMVTFWHFFEVRRDDFIQMFVHHITTVFLILFSYLINFVRIGSLVFLIHDISDIPASLVKLSNYMKWRTLSVIFFALTLAFWGYFRLYIFPTTIIKSAMFDSVTIVTDPAKRYGWFFFNSMMTLLLSLHVIWYSLFLKILWKLLRKNEAHDLTEHRRGEKQD